MKRIGMVACMALTLCTTPQSVGAHGCELFWAIPLALGVGAAIGSAFAPHPTYVYPPPTYVYSPPVYTYSYPPPSPTPSAPAVSSYSQPQPMVAQRTYTASAVKTVPAPQPVSYQQVAWTPKTMATGHWVPDAHPYVYIPEKGAPTTTVASKANAQGHTVHSSTVSAPPYVVSR